MIFTSLLPKSSTTNIHDQAQANDKTAQAVSISSLLSLSRPTGFIDVDDMFGGSGFPSGRIVHIHSEILPGSTLLIMSTMVECLKKGYQVTLINTHNSINPSLLKHYLETRTSTETEYNTIISKLKIIRLYDMWSVLAYLDHQQSMYIKNMKAKSTHATATSSLPSIDTFHVQNFPSFQQQQQLQSLPVLPLSSMSVDDDDLKNCENRYDDVLIIDDLNHIISPLMDDAVNIDAIVSSLFLHLKYLSTNFVTTVITVTSADPTSCGTGSYYSRISGTVSSSSTSNRFMYNCIPLTVFHEGVDISLVLKTASQQQLSSITTATHANENSSSSGASIINQIGESVSKSLSYFLEVTRRPPYYVDRPIQCIITSS